MFLIVMLVPVSGVGAGVFNCGPGAAGCIYFLIISTYEISNFDCTYHSYVFRSTVPTYRTVVFFCVCSDRMCSS